ncbi:MAG: hypothetical protein LBJ82_00580, partial [Deltaproteobacteria bacterium]|nr:hypothetical protein [Deltaproteobacteria bacterium]
TQTDPSCVPWLTSSGFDKAIYLNLIIISMYYSKITCNGLSYAIGEQKARLSARPPPRQKLLKALRKIILSPVLPAVGLE